MAASATHTAIRCKTLKFKYGCRPPSAHPVKAGHRDTAALGGAGLPPRSAHPLERTAWRRWRSQLRSAQAAARAKGRRGERRGVRRRAGMVGAGAVRERGAGDGGCTNAADTVRQQDHLHQNRYVLIYCTARMTALPDYASTMHAPSHTSTEAIASRLDAGRARARRRRNAC